MAASLVRQHIVTASMADLKRTLIVGYPSCCQVKLTSTDTVALPASPGHQHSLDSMRHPHLLHSDLIHKDIQLAEIRWYCQTLHIHTLPVST
jgi:hypothetical protein